MDEAAPRGVHALSFASLAHKSFIKDVSFAYTESRKAPPQDPRGNTDTKGPCMPLRGVSRRPFVFALHFAPLFLSQFITCCHLNVLITCNSIFTILMEVAIVMEIRRSCPQRTQIGSTLHPCITLVWLEILYYTLQHKDGCVDASGDSSLLIYPHCHGFEDYRKHKADFISDVEEHVNPESSLCPTPPPSPIPTRCCIMSLCMSLLSPTGRGDAS